MPDSASENKIWTIGHSTRSISELEEILNSFKINLLVDVRRYPGSKKFPHFNREQMEISLPDNGIGYLHLENLGGRRKVDKGSKNTAWRLASFQGYADYMETERFIQAADQLQKLAAEKKVAYLCSEAVWWSCHRSLISDYLKIRGWEVNHIMGPNKDMEHPYTKPAQVVDGKLSYQKQQSEPE